MRLSDVLLMRGMVRNADIERAVERQREQGGRLGDNLIALGLMTTEQLFAVMNETPCMPRSAAETGLSRAMLQSLLLKIMRVGTSETVPELAVELCLPHGVIQEIIDDAINQKLLHVLGSVNGGVVRYMRYALSDQGRVAAAEAMEQCQYAGPAPVSLAAFQAQVQKQKITNESLDLRSLRSALSGLVVSEPTIRRLVPAVSAGRTVLLHGAPGNGKTSIGKRIASLFKDVVFIPHAIEVAGQIIKMYDAAMHKPAASPLPQATIAANGGVQIEAFDGRWVACKRPVAVAGGEMTLDMLDLRWDPVAKIYEAPLHMKALNGMFLIDDFGRQKVDPSELLNRWIVPLENRIDYLKLNSGATFELPFDELVIFSTNMEPADLMDPAFLRRIPYKIELSGPNTAEYRRIFERAAAASGLTLTDQAFDYVVRKLTAEGKFTLAAFQPKFICDQVEQVCLCFKLEPILTPSLAAEALENLYVGIGGATPEELSFIPTPLSRGGGPGNRRELLSVC
jgi:hypothetical protein